MPCGLLHGEAYPPATAARRMTLVQRLQSGLDTAIPNYNLHKMSHTRGRKATKRGLYPDVALGSLAMATLCVGTALFSALGWEKTETLR